MMPGTVCNYRLDYSKTNNEAIFLHVNNHISPAPQWSFTHAELDQEIQQVRQRYGGFIQEIEQCLQIQTPN